MLGIKASGLKALKIKKDYYFLFAWVDQTRTDITHYQKMVFFQIKLQLNKNIKIKFWLDKIKKKKVFFF